MRKLIVVAHISADGFVAGPNGEFDNFTGAAESLHFVCSLIDGADAAMFGRVSYQLLEAHWPTAAGTPGASADDIKYSNWYNNAAKIVLSTTLPAGLKNATVINGDIAERINEIKQQEGKDILIFGSPAAVHALMEYNVVDGFWLLLYPVLFGKGISLFKNTDKVTKLQLAEVKQIGFGITCLHYEVSK